VIDEVEGDDSATKRRSFGVKAFRRSVIERVEEALHAHLPV
jgi:hypothetical protein